MATRSSIQRLRLGLAIAALGALAVAVLWRSGQRTPTQERFQSVDARDRLEEMFAVPPDTIPIAWNEWAEPTFARARRDGIPIVALLDASWCESCVLYAATLAASPEVRRTLEGEVVAVRVDADRRPDVHARYHVTFDTLPTWIFLTTEGDVWDLTGPQRPSQLRASIRELRAGSRRAHDVEIELLRARGDHELLRTARIQADPARGARTGDDVAGIDAGALTRARADSIVQGILDALVGAWPHPEDVLEFDTPILEWDALGFLRRHADRTHSPVSRELFLLGLRQLLASPLLVDGSALRETEACAECVSRARFLDTNATLLDHFRIAAQWSDDAMYAEAARRVENYVSSTLYDAEVRLFRGAQGTLVLDEAGWPLLRGDEYARMRDHSDAGLVPHVVPLFPTPGNARAFVALPSHDAVPLALERLWEHFEQDGRIPHDFALDVQGRVVASDREFLVDVVELGRAILAIRAELPRADIWLGRCSTLADTLVARYQSPHTALLRDRPHTELAHTRRVRSFAPARMNVPLTPVVQNAQAAIFLSELAAQTGDAKYRKRARGILRACVDALASTSVWEASEVGTALLQSEF